MHDNKHPNTAYYNAVEIGQMEYVKKYWHMDFVTKAMNLAIQFDQFEVLKYPISCGVYLNYPDTKIVAQYGRVEVMKYLHKFGVYMNTTEMVTAVQYGHLEAVKYINNSWPTQSPTSYYRMEMLSAAKETATIFGKKDCYEYLIGLLK